MASVIKRAGGGRDRFTQREKVYGGVAVAVLLFASGMVLRGRGKRQQYNELLKEIEVAQASTVVGSGGAQVNLYDAVNGIADALGVNASWWNPASWTENEYRATQIILSVPDSQMGQLQHLYLVKYGRNLRDDMQRYGKDYWSGVNYWYLVKHKFL